MLWVTNPKTKRPAKLVHTDELEAEYREWLAGDCSHPNKQLMAIAVRLGKPQIREQCPDCGKPFGSAIPHSSVGDLSKLMNGTADDQYEYDRNRKASIDAIKLRHLALQTKPGWGTSEYGEYLKSPEWQRKRLAVLRRANGICEGCGQNDATVVHHHHYNSIYDEWLWDLAALCRPCHSKCHPEHRTGDD
ncbi:MAG: hypothetical protein KGM49_15355 [Sphingomonadales bacterium]|nr:hypothetical protein [Sphingomonadales bacterium]